MRINMRLKGNTLVTHSMCITRIKRAFKAVMHIKCVTNVLHFMRILMRIKCIGATGELVIGAADNLVWPDY